MILAAGPLLIAGIGGIGVAAIAASYGIGRALRLPHRMALLVAWMRERDPAVPVLLTTGYDDEMSLDGPKAGSLEVLGKIMMSSPSLTIPVLPRTARGRVVHCRAATHHSDISSAPQVGIIHPPDLGKLRPPLTEWRGVCVAGLFKVEERFSMAHVCPERRLRRASCHQLR